MNVDNIGRSIAISNRTDNKIISEKPDTSFKGENEPEAPVSSGLAQAYLGIKPSSAQKITPLTLGDLMATGEPYNDKERSALINWSRRYPQFSDLVKMKDDRGRQVFNFNDMLYIVDLYDRAKPLADGDIDDETLVANIKELAALEDKEGNRLYGGDYIKDILTSKNKESRATLISNIKELKDIEKNGSPRFKFYEIRELAKIGSEHMGTIKGLADLTTTDGKPRFNDFDIRKLIGVYEDRTQKDNLLELSKLEVRNSRPQYSVEEMKDLLEIMQEFPKEVLDLSKIRTSEGNQRFSAEDVKKLAEPYNMPELKGVIEKLAAEENQKKAPAYSADNILNILKAMKSA